MRKWYGQFDAYGLLLATMTKSLFQPKLLGPHKAERPPPGEGDGPTAVLRLGAGPVERCLVLGDPELVIRSEFAGWTGYGLVRQAALKGLYLEKDPKRVIRERPKG